MGMLRIALGAAMAISVLTTGCASGPARTFAPMQYHPSLAEPAVIVSTLRVTEFGMPADSKFVFCDGADCPERTPKAINLPEPSQPQPLPMPAAVSAQLAPPAPLPIASANMPPPLVAASEELTKQSEPAHATRPHHRRIHHSCLAK